LRVFESKSTKQTRRVKQIVTMIVSVHFQTSCTQRNKEGIDTEEKSFVLLRSSFLAKYEDKYCGLSFTHLIVGSVYCGFSTIQAFSSTYSTRENGIRIFSLGPAIGLHCKFERLNFHILS